MVMASWPQHAVRAGRAPSVEIRRLAERALRRATRHVVRFGAPLLALVLVLDNALALVELGVDAAPGVWLDLAVVGSMISLRRMVSRGRWAPEPASMATLLLVFVSLMGEMWLPAPSGGVRAGLTLASLVTLILASGLFLPWHPRWHAGWLAAAAGLSALVVLTAPTLDFGAGEPARTMLTIGAAALASGVGQAIGHARLRRMLEQRFELRRLMRYVRLQETRVEALDGELTRTARLDTVTGIGNRRALDEALAGLAGRRLAAVLFDLDHFKAFNDRNGHLSGDAALARVGEILRSSVRGRDLVFRYGGEEFLILLPGGELTGAARLAERIRVAVEHDQQTGSWGLTMSAGVAVADRFNSTNPTQLLRRADQALYQAKRLGRNRVVVDGAASPASEAAAS